MPFSRPVATLVRALGLCAVLAGWTVAAATPAAADNFTFYSSPHRDGPWDGPPCDKPEVLKRIHRYFDETETAYWHTGVKMAQIVHVRETAFRDWDPPIIARRYCSATAYLTDGRRYELVYWLRSEQGFAGVGWGVQYCLVGRDRDFAYAPACKMLRPL